MGELEELKARAKKRRANVLTPLSSPQGLQLKQAEADLDHAIAIAGIWEADAREAVKKLNQARADAANACGYPGCTKRYVHVWNIGVGLCEEHHEKCIKPVEQMRADVLKLRFVVANMGGFVTSEWAQVLADTEHYEQYRKGPSDPDGAAEG